MAPSKHVRSLFLLVGHVKFVVLLLLLMIVMGSNAAATNASTGPLKIFNSLKSSKIRSFYFPPLAQQFLGPQNAARAQVGVPPLIWDNRLAAYAQSWANRQRIFGACLLRHSGGPYGENIFWGRGRNWIPADAVSSWMHERQWYDYNSNTCLYYNACGHYTQVVSRFSQRVGCARAVCADGDVFMTCNYYPPGNNGQRPF